MYLEDDLKNLFYGLRDGEDLDSFKIGVREERNFRTALDYFRRRFEYNVVKSGGTKNNFEISNSKPCFYSYAKDNKFNYKLKKLLKE